MSAADGRLPRSADRPDAARASELEIVHETRYDYGAAVTLAHHLAHLRPLDDAGQRLLAHALEIEPAAQQRRDAVDAWGNHACHFTLLVPHPELVVRATSRVAVATRFAGLDAAASPPWEALVERLRYVARAPFEPAVEFAQPSPFVPRLAELRDWAAPCFAPGRAVAELAIELMHRLHADFAYETRSTEVDTPLAVAFAQRRGVCQDFAHLLAGALRMHGLPARYVSGYLLTRPPEDGPALVGADASHAWVQVWCPATPGVADGWLDLDPTNDLVPGSGHVRVAVGRDYGDVAPLRGVIRGGGRHALTVAVTTRRAGAADGIAGPAPPAGSA